MNLAERIKAQRMKEKQEKKIKEAQEIARRMVELGAPKYERILELVEKEFTEHKYTRYVKIVNAGFFKPMVEGQADCAIDTICAIAEQHFDDVSKFLEENGFIVKKTYNYMSQQLYIYLPD